MADSPDRPTGPFRVKRGLAEMLTGGVIMDVVDPDQAKVAEDAGATAVMALERVPSDIRRDGGVARMSDPEMIEGIKAVVTNPVMAKARIGHFVEATTHFRDPDILAKVSRGLGAAMPGLEIGSLETKLADRGW